MTCGSALMPPACGPAPKGAQTARQAPPQGPGSPPHPAGSAREDEPRARVAGNAIMGARRCEAARAM